jgi:predicted Fe-S protein YdhL (DUF1289 family)
MSEATADIATRLRLSDPKPGFCSACWTAAGEDVRFVDFDCLLDRGVHVQEGTMAVLDAMDSLHLCESCVRQAAEVLAYKPVEAQRRLREIRRLEIENEHWRDYAKNLERTLRERPEPAPSAPKRSGRAA